MRAHRQTSGLAKEVSDLHYDLLPTGLGWIGVLASGHGIRSTTLPHSSPQEALAALGPEARQARHTPGAFASLHRKLHLYLNGKEVIFDEPLDTAGAPAFFSAAWQACRRIPRGETRSYAWLAIQAGRPGAARAAGQAMARNRFPLVVPCHRVLGSNGELCGFGGGLDLKRHLLDMEKKQRQKLSRRELVGLCCKDVGTARLRQVASSCGL